MDTLKIDQIALSGYEYAEGSGLIPDLNSQFEIDCFNAGISNFNVRNNTHIPPIKEGMKTTWVQGSSNGCSDKELAIVGA